MLDGFDRWRRAVGVRVAPAEAGAGAPKRGTLHAHVDRVVVQLAAALGSDRAPDGAAAGDPGGADARSTRVQADERDGAGAARDALIAALAEVDRALARGRRRGAAAASACAALTREADAGTGGVPRPSGAGAVGGGAWRPPAAVSCASPSACPS